MVNQIYVLRLFQGEVHRGLHHKIRVPILLLSLLIFNLKDIILVLVLTVCLIFTPYLQNAESTSSIKLLFLKLV